MNKSNLLFGLVLLATLVNLNCLAEDKQLKKQITGKSKGLVKPVTYLDEFFINYMALSSFKNNERAVIDYKGIAERFAKGDSVSAIKADKETVELINKIQFETTALFPARASLLEWQDMEILNNSARIPKKSNQLARAEQALINVLANKPGSAAAWENYAEILARSGKEVLAIGAYANAIRFSENHEKTIRFLTAQLAKEKDPIVVSAIKTALSKSPQIAEWHECSLPIKIGDTIDQVQQAFRVNPITVPSNYTEGARFMNLGNIGISLTFFVDGKIEQISLKEPFCGTINGLGIGDDLANLQIKMGMPKHPPSNFGDREYFYDFEEDKILSFKVNNANVITKIGILFNRTLFNQKNRAGR